MARAAGGGKNGVAGAAAHLGIDLAEYDAKIRTFIPDYETMIDLAAFALQVTARRRAPVVVDLGIGTGALAERCLARIPAARIVGVDEDDAMIAAARRRLGRGLRSVVHGSFETVDLPACDAIVASLSLHHVPTPERRLALFRRLHAALRPDGVLISADCYPETNARLAAADRATWMKHLESSYAPSVARQYLRTWAKEDHYALLVDEIDTLRRAGFAVNIPSRRGTFAVLVASTS
jgi:tRNA (cmo5U34)-methyltransferase